jgi:hypothetical protein
LHPEGLQSKGLPIIPKGTVLYPKKNRPNMFYFKMQCGEDLILPGLIPGSDYYNEVSKITKIPDHPDVAAK